MSKRNTKMNGEVAMLGVALKVTRKRYKLSQPELSALTGVTVSYIHRIESGKQAASAFVLSQLGKGIPLPELLRSWANLMEL